MQKHEDPTRTNVVTSPESMSPRYASNDVSQRPHSKNLQPTPADVLCVRICAMFIASRALHMNISRFSSEPTIRLDLNKVRLTGSTTFLTIVKYFSVRIYAA